MNNVPTEQQEQEALFAWRDWKAKKYPELMMLFHIPNEGKRSVVNGARMKAAGLSSGMPDICLPVARNGYHALYIELKRTKGGKVSEKQRERIASLNALGNKAIVCYGWVEAAAEIEKYLCEDVKQLSACLHCVKRKGCLASAHYHKETDKCFVKEVKL